MDMDIIVHPSIHPSNHPSIFIARLGETLLMSSMLTDHSLHYITLRYTIHILAIENYPQTHTHTHIYTHIQSVDKYTRIHNQDTGHTQQ